MVDFVISYVGICTSAFPMCLCQAVRAKQVVKYLVEETFSLVLAAIEIGVIT